MKKGGIAVAPHADAARVAAAVLGEGGNAIEAMVAAAATIAVVYPHMNGIGGDAFWLVHEPGGAPRAIDACGPAGMRVDAAFYGERVSAQSWRNRTLAGEIAGNIDDRFPWEVGGDRLHHAAVAFAASIGFERVA